MRLDQLVGGERGAADGPRTARRTAGPPRRRAASRARRRPSPPRRRGPSRGPAGRGRPRRRAPARRSPRRRPGTPSSTAGRSRPARSRPWRPGRGRVQDRPEHPRRVADAGRDERGRRPPPAHDEARTSGNGSVSRIGLPGQQHDQPVDADAEATGRRHRVLQRLEEVLVELHRLRVAAGGQQRLRGEPAALLDRVDQLRVGGAQLDAERDQVPALGQPRVARGAAGSAATPRSGSPCRTWAATVFASTRCSYISSSDGAAVPLRVVRDLRLVAEPCAARADVGVGVTSSPSASEIAPLTVLTGQSPEMSTSSSVPRPARRRRCRTRRSPPPGSAPGSGRSIVS